MWYAERAAGWKVGCVGRAAAATADAGPGRIDARRSTIGKRRACEGVDETQTFVRTRARRLDQTTSLFLMEFVMFTRQSRRGSVSVRGRKSPAGVMARAGRVRKAAPFVGLDQLENRILLGGDHPSFSLPLTPTSGTLIEIDPVTGVGTLPGGLPVTGTIDPAGDDDLFRFTAPANDFVTVWADTVNATGSTLNSRVEVYNISGTVVASGSSQGTLTGGTFTDGWAGFVAEAGTQYFVRVRSDLPVGPGSTGNYIVRVDAITETLTLNAMTGNGNITGSITIAGNDIVYRMTIPSGAGFESLAAIGGAQFGTLDPRVDVYNSAGVHIVGDSQSGRLNDAFLAFRSRPEATFYVRLRGDQFMPSHMASTGDAVVVAQTNALTIAMDPVTRLGFGGGVAGGQIFNTHRFQAQGTGLAIITMVGVPLPPLADPALRLYNDEGTLIAFNDDYIGTAAEIQIRLDGGRTYFIVAEGFDVANAGSYQIGVESVHTFDIVDDVDDHVDLPDLTGDPDDIRRQFELATPMVFHDVLGISTGPIPAYDPASPIDHSRMIVANATGRIHAAGDTDLFMFVPPVDMLGMYRGRDNGAMPRPSWELWQRPSTRVQVLLNAAGATSFLTQPQLRVYDSNFNLVFTGGPLVVGMPPPPLTPATIGGLNPAAFPPELNPLVDPFLYARQDPWGFMAWGGEPYFIEVAGSVTGRYSLNVQVDAMPTEFDPLTGEWIDRIDGGMPPNMPVSYIFREPAGAGQFALAPEISLNQATGDGTTANTPGAANGYWGGTFYERVYERPNANPPTPPNPPPTPPSRGGLLPPNPPFNPFAAGGGVIVLQESGLNGLHSVTDVDTFFFRAPADGTAEIRINTTALNDWFVEFIGDGWDDETMPQGEVNQLEKIYNSWLNSALRVFNNDFVEIAYNNYNPAITGESETTTVGSNTRTFWRRDARVVIDVRAGERYFIQVESGQLQAYTTALDAANGVIADADFSTVDWRHAYGSYELLINTMPNLTLANDDHVNTIGPQSTVLAIDNTTGTATISGQILHVPVFNPNDTDTFTFIAPGSGVAEIRVARVTGGSLIPSVFVFDADQNVVASGNAGPTGVITVSTPARQGERFFIGIAGAGGTQGGYTVQLTGLPYVSDHANRWDWSNATEILIRDFLGTGNATGAIENPGDVDIFKFDVLDFDLATVTITGQTIGFSPRVRVYEVGLDNTSTSPLVTIINPVLLRIAENDAAGGSIASAAFSITAPNRQPLNPNQTNIFNTYYIVVSGSNPNTHAGNYNLAVVVQPTDDHADEGEFEFATVVVIDPITGDADASGVIEIASDSDLFRFTAPAGGFGSITVSAPVGSTMRPRIRMFDQDQQPLADTMGNFARQGADSLFSSATFTFQAIRGRSYYLLVDGVPGGMLTTQTGAYTIDWNMPTVDDHANITEFTLATPIPLSVTTGNGLSAGVIGVNGDTDLFYFDSHKAGDHVITVTTPSSEFNPRISIYFTAAEPASIIIVDGDGNDEDGDRDGNVTYTVDVTSAGQRVWILVSADLFGFFQTGSYTIAVEGIPPDVNPFPNDDDHANRGDFMNATPILLSSRTGYGDETGIIDYAGDTDLFQFSSLASGRAFIQVVTPTGSLMDAIIRVFNQPSEPPFLTNTEGIPGANAYATFNISGANQIHYIEVYAAGSGVGSYTVRVQVAPETFFLYFPEGFASSHIREFLSIANPSTSDSVTYKVTLYYEDSSLDPTEITPTGGAVLAPGTRGGLTISDASNGVITGVHVDQPYAIVIESSGFLGATLARYDFGLGLGETLTGQTSTVWTFARVERNPGGTNDFLTFFNPNNHEVEVTLTAYTSIGQVVLKQTVGANRRGGWNINDTTALPTGAFGVVLTSAPVNGSASHIGIVASLSHFGVGTAVGYMLLGDPTGGTTHGVVTSLTSSGAVTPQLMIFNPGPAVASVTITGTYIRAQLPNLVRVFEVPARESISLGSAQLGLINDQPVGLRYSSTAPVTVASNEAQFGDANGSGAATAAGTSWFFGDGFVNPATAGDKYFETITLYNPDTVSLPVAVTLLFNTGQQSTVNINVAARGFAAVDIHTLQAVVGTPSLKFFSIQATAQRPFVASMTHYDLFLGGGWGSNGAPLGLTNPLSTIV